MNAQQELAQSELWAHYIMALPLAAIIWWVLC